MLQRRWHDQRRTNALEYRLGVAFRSLKKLLATRH